MNNKNLITVYNEAGEKVGVTYPRRALQLVNKNRARWLESAKKDSSICLIDETETEMEGEQEKMDIYSTEPIANNTRTAKTGDVIETHKPDYERSSEFAKMVDEDMYRMVKESLFDRFALIMHWGAFIFSQAAIWIIFPIFGWYWLGILDVLWFVGIAMHTLYYMARITPSKILKEYDRISRRK